MDFELEAFIQPLFEAVGYQQNPVHLLRVLREKKIELLLFKDGAPASLKEMPLFEFISVELWLTAIRKSGYTMAFENLKGEWFYYPEPRASDGALDSVKK